MKNASNRIPLSIWILPSDDEELTKIVESYTQASRHIVALAVVRAGLRLLRDHPEDVVAHLADQGRSKRMRFRG